MSDNEHYYMSCIFCGGRLIWNSSANAADTCADYDESDTAAVNYYRCDHCGRDYEIVEPPEEERETVYADYWKVDNKPTNYGKTQTTSK